MSIFRWHSNPNFRPKHYTDLVDLPVILVIVEKGKMGITYPKVGYYWQGCPMTMTLMVCHVHDSSSYSSTSCMTHSNCIEIEKMINILTSDVYFRIGDTMT